MTEHAIWKTAFENAQRELQQAWQNFQNAEPEFIDIAILELAAKEKKLDRVYKKLQELEMMSA